eukprot:Colp12_sorted_trinity150504_noHs@5837
MHQSMRLLLALLLAQAALSFVVPPAKTVRLLHTTDIHGWIAGHRHIARLNADFGDFKSLIDHMSTNSKETQAYDFLLMDTGDLVEGTGLSDATPIHGQYILNVIAELPYDAMTVGNHDLGNPDTIGLIQTDLVATFGEKYITSNTFLRETGKPLGGSQYRFFTTPLGVKVLVFGFIFNFAEAAKVVSITNVEDSLKEEYFTEAMKLDADVVFAIMHAAPDQEECKMIYQALRASKPNTPLILLTGHSHIVDFRQFDDQAYAFESGHYFQQFGLIEFQILGDGTLKLVNHTAVETQLKNFYELGLKAPDTFPTEDGEELTALIKKQEASLNLDTVVACAPTSFSRRASLNKPYSFYNLYLNTMVPKFLFAGRQGNTPLIFSSVGFLRDDLYNGTVVEDDIFSIDPFNDDYVLFAGLDGADVITLADDLRGNGLAKDHMLKIAIPKTTTQSVDRYVMNNVTLTEEITYDVVSTGYDGFHISDRLAALFPSKNYTKVAYPTSLSSRDVIRNYIKTTFPCPQ